MCFHVFRALQVGWNRNIKYLSPPERFTGLPIFFFPYWNEIHDIEHDLMILSDVTVTLLRQWEKRIDFYFSLCFSQEQETISFANTTSWQTCHPKLPVPVKWVSVGQFLPHAVSPISKSCRMWLKLSFSAVWDSFPLIFAGKVAGRHPLQDLQIWEESETSRKSYLKIPLERFISPSR